MLTLAILLCLPILTEAFTSFKTNCTLPSNSAQVNYVSSPDIRGTLNIAWSCVFTIIACTWTVQNPNAPWQREHYSTGRRGWWKWTMTKYAGLVGWFFTTIVAPEWLLMKYLGDYLEARKYVRDCQKYAEEDKVQWTASHYHFARMGAFVMRTHIENRRPQSCDRSVQTEATASEGDVGGISQNPSPSPPQHDEGGLPSVQDPPPFPAQTGKEKVRGQANQDIDTEKGRGTHGQTTEKPNPYFLQPYDILTLRQKGVLTHLPRITQQEIQDRSKADGLMRAITVAQILWLCIQVIGRAAEDLSVTQLELATVAFAICAVFMYVFSWDKTKGVQIPVTILQVHDDGEEVHALLKKEVKEDDPLSHPDQQERERNLGWIVPNSLSSHWGLVIVGIVFGTVHLAAWNLTFPTQIERVLWRAASIYCSGFPPCFVFLNYLSMALLFFEIKAINKGHSRTVKTLFLLVLLTNLVHCLSTLAYVVARLYLLVEMFRTLAYQPSDAYMGTWAVNIPYIS
ncbi:uncharacterized protein N7503_001774 [Penicillium pulvis]|uniref:uncharacterized protein n=1 Tax=Penicillium pulvis TaxID=1562058 RepID=UPI002547EA94|nr:uncharacterized protein N7503_001774 [Penicillium pulvis]KAJ5809556.1 hypothetical protein N7503_001774 [Penicillium pulvis]